MSVSKIVPLTNVGLLSAAIERTHSRPMGLPGLVVMYGASGLGKVWAPPSPPTCTAPTTSNAATPGARKLSYRRSCEK